MKDKDHVNPRLARLPARCVIPITRQDYDGLMKMDRKGSRYAEPGWILERQRKPMPRTSRGPNHQLLILFHKTRNNVAWTNPSTRTQLNHAKPPKRLRPV